MLSDQDHGDHEYIRDIHALTPPHPPPANHNHLIETWETSNHRSSSLSMASASEAAASSENNFTTSMSREFNALAIAAGSTTGNQGSDNEDTITGNDLARIGEEEVHHEELTNLWAIVPDNSHLNPVPSPRRDSSSSTTIRSQSEVSVERVKKEEVDSKISAWETAEIAKINNKFKRENAIINGCETEEVQMSTLWMKKVERKLEEKRARALEKMQNKVAKAHKKAEERRASAEAKRGTKVAKVLEISNLMRAIGRAPTKKSFF